VSHVHVIPVLPGATPEDTWAELCVMGRLDPPAPKDCQWAAMACDGEQCQGIDRKVRV
jgi:hypothetical protein